MKGYRIFAQNTTTAFFTSENEEAVSISFLNQFAAHELDRYRKNDYLGELTGNFKVDEEGNVNQLEIEIPYYHWLTAQIRFLGKSFTIPDGVKSSVRLWVSPDDIVDETMLPFSQTNPVARMIPQLRILGEMFVVSSPRLNWLATRLRIVKYC